MNRRQSHAGPPPGWTPVRQLPELARALLSSDLGGRDAVPAHVANRVRALAEQWAAHGFTARTVGPWTDLDPPCAAYLSGRGVPPDALDELVDLDGPAGQSTVRAALSTGRLTAEQAYQALAAAGRLTAEQAYQALAATSGAQPAPRAKVPPTGQKPEPPATHDAPRTSTTPAPVVFSHAETDHSRDHGRDEPHPAARPSRTPFRR